MKTTRFLLFATGTAVVMLAGCSAERQLGNTFAASAPVEVRFAGNVDAIVTRVGGAQGNEWNAIDRVGIYMVNDKHDNLSPFADGDVAFANKPYTASAGELAAFTPDDGKPLYYPSEEDRVTFTAYHPYSESAGADGKVSFSVADQSDLSAIDLLHAPADGSYDRYTTEAVKLSFRHKLAKLVFNVKNGAGVTEPVTNGIKVAIAGQYTSGTLDLATGAIEAAGTTSTLTATAAAGSTTVEAIVLPAATLAGVKFTFTNAAGRSFELTAPATIPAWEEGKRHTYTVTLRAADKPSDITGSIDGWDNGGTAPGTANEEDGKLKPFDETHLNGRITWDGSGYVLTDDPTNAGLYFKFGSVAGLYSGNGVVATLPEGANGDQFDAGDVAWSPVEVTTWESVPVYDVNDSPKTVTLADGYHTVANVKAGKGDPCRLVGLDLAKIKNTAAASLTAADVDNGKWRLPTVEENKAFSGHEDNTFYGQEGFIENSDNWTTLGGVNGVMLPTVAAGSAATFLPATGCRSYLVENHEEGQNFYQTFSDFGIVTGHNIYGNFMTSEMVTANNINNDVNQPLYHPRIFSFAKDCVAPLSYGDNWASLSVRCVRQ